MLRFNSNNRSVMRCPVRGVQIAGGLVREQYGRMRHEGARNGDALLFAAGQLLRVVRHSRRQPHLRERRRRRLARVAPAAEFQRQHDVLDRRERGNKMKRLKHKPDMLAANGRAAVFVEFGEIDARDQHAAGARRIESREQRQQRGLARARGADDGQGFAGSHTEAHIGENGERPRRGWRPSSIHSWLRERFDLASGALVKRLLALIRLDRCIRSRPAPRHR